MDTKLTPVLSDFLPRLHHQTRFVIKLWMDVLLRTTWALLKDLLGSMEPTLKTTYLKGPIKQQYSISVVLENIHFKGSFRHIET